MPEEYVREKDNLVLPFEIKALGEPDSEGMVNFEGYAAAFGNVDLGNDVIEQGAFAETLKEDQNWPIYLDHIALMENTAGYNLSAVEDNFGLRIKGQLNIKVEAGRIAYELAKQAKAIGKNIGLSIGYGTKEKTYDETTGIRTLKKLKMYEYSFTNHAMNTLASFTNFKSRFMSEIKSALKELLAEDPDLLKAAEPETMEPGEDQDMIKSILSKLNAINSKED